MGVSGNAGAGGGRETFRVSGRDLLLPPGKGAVFPGRRGPVPPPIVGETSTPHFLFVLPKRKRAVDGPKEKGAFPDEQGSSWPLNRAVRGFRPPGYGAVLFPRFNALVRWASEPGIQHRTGRHCQEAAQVSEAAEIAASAGSAAAVVSAEAIRQLAPPRQRKLQIACFRLAAKTRSLRCASSPHKISDFAGAPNAQLSGWRSPAISRGS